MKTKEMNRPQIIWELARYAHPTWYHSLLEWPTEQLRGLLAYYRDESKVLPAGRIYVTKGLKDSPEPPRREPVICIGIDWGSDHRVVASIHRYHADGRIEVLQTIITKKIPVKHG